MIDTLKVRRVIRKLEGETIPLVKETLRELYQDIIGVIFKIVFIFVIIVIIGSICGIC